MHPEEDVDLVTALQIYIVALKAKQVLCPHSSSAHSNVWLPYCPTWPSLESLSWTAWVSLALAWRELTSEWLGSSGHRAPVVSEPPLPPNSPSHSPHMTTTGSRGFSHPRPQNLTGPFLLLFPNKHSDRHQWCHAGWFYSMEMVGAPVPLQSEPNQAQWASQEVQLLDGKRRNKQKNLNT